MLVIRTRINHSPAHYCNAVHLSLVILTSRNGRSSNKFNLPVVFLPITAYRTVQQLCEIVSWAKRDKSRLGVARGRTKSHERTCELYTLLRRHPINGEHQVTK